MERRRKRNPVDRMHYRNRRQVLFRSDYAGRCKVVGVVLGSAFRLLAWGVRVVLLPFEFLFWIIGAVVRVFVWLGEAIGNTAGFIVTFIEKLNLFKSGAKLIDSLTAGIKSKIIRAKNRILT